MLFVSRYCLCAILHLVNEMHVSICHLFSLPIIKKASLDPDHIMHHKPVSHLKFVSTILEKVVLLRLEVHRSKTHLVERYQSAYRKGHSTETALLRVQTDVLRTVDDGKCVLLMLSVLAVEFYTV